MVYYPQLRPLSSLLLLNHEHHSQARKGSEVIQIGQGIGKERKGRKGGKGDRGAG